MTAFKREDPVTLLRKQLQSAIYRIDDMLMGDDGQAWKEAEKARPAMQKALDQTAPESESGAALNTPKEELERLWARSPQEAYAEATAKDNEEKYRREKLNRVTGILHDVNVYCQLNKIGNWGESASKALMDAHSRLVEAVEQYKAAEQYQIGLRQRMQDERDKAMAAYQEEELAGDDIRDVLRNVKAERSKLEKDNFELSQRNSELCGYLESYAQILRDRLMDMRDQRANPEIIDNHVKELQAVEAAKQGQPSPQLLNARIRDVVMDWRSHGSHEAALLAIVCIIDGVGK